jgi:hypothetical protein
VGAQAAALLGSGGPVGDVPPPLEPAVVVDLAVPDLRRTALSHAGVGLAPTGWDGRALHTRLGRTRVAVDGTTATADGPLDLTALRVVLDLDTDLEPLWQATDRHPRWRWVRARGAGRLLRSPTAWQDAVGVLASTNASYAATRRMVAALVADGPFPSPDEVTDLGEEELRRRGWGYRAPHLLALAARVDEGWRDPTRSTAEVAAEVRALPGFGPFATASLLPLLGRPRPLVADGWLARLVDVDDYRVLGEHAGTVMWLDVSERWISPSDR